MKTTIISTLVLLGLTICSIAQNAKVYIEPSTADVTINGSLTKSPVKINYDKPLDFIVAHQKGYVTWGSFADDVLKDGRGKTQYSIQLEKIKELPKEAVTRKIEFSKLVDGTGRLGEGGYYYAVFYSGYSGGIDINDAKFTKPMTQLMEDWGYHMVGTNTIFEEKGDVPSLALAGEISEWGKDTKGSGFQASVLVAWSVFDVRKKKVVLEFKTAGFSDSRKDLQFGDELTLALKDALKGVLSNEEFQDLALREESPEATLEATFLDEVMTKDYSTYGDMVKNAVNSVLTVKTDQGHGSGFLISEDGHILTNNHVIDGAEEVEVIFDNGFTFKGEVLKTSEDRDVALLKISGSGFKPLRINTNAEAVSLGEEVIAIGTPADISLGQTVTKGIISGKRVFEEQNYIQTDVSINPGNSGGPLINENGEVLGIVVLKIKHEDIDGLGFAIPVSEACSKLNINFD